MGAIVSTPNIKNNGNALTCIFKSCLYTWWSVSGNILITIDIVEIKIGTFQ